MLRAVWFGILVAASEAYVLSGHVSAPHVAVRGAASMAAKGFGKAAPPPPPSKKKSEGAVKRDKAASDFDNLKKSGAPEYMVLIRTVDSAGEPSKWYPVGGMAIPRSSSIDQALSLAIFENEDDLLKGAFRSYPFLKKSTDKFEYGYRIKEFEDDPIKVASKEKADDASNPLTQWCAPPGTPAPRHLASIWPALMLAGCRRLLAGSMRWTTH
jgi:hypothetical protein